MSSANQGDEFIVVTRGSKKRNAGIDLTSYHPPRAPRGFCTEMCAQPQGF